MASELQSFGTVLITGGTGSLGRALIRHLLTHDRCDRVIAIARNAELRYRLEADYPDPRLVVAPGDVRMIDDLEAAWDSTVDTIIHAAAEKHISTGQRYGHYVTSTNVDGARNVVRYARQVDASRVLALSTDKACNPVPHQAYGQSKAQAERLFVAANRTSATRCSLVRYGNVVASSGSVVPLFIRQRRSGCLTVTDRRMTRYFMPLSDDAEIRLYQEPGARPIISAVGLIMRALEVMRGGEIFIPQIPSGSILNLAQQIGPGCCIDEIGIRDGEKLHEELIAAGESDRCWLTPDGLYVLTATAHDVPGFPATRVPAGFRYTSNDDPQPIQFEISDLAGVR